MSLQQDDLGVDRGGGRVAMPKKIADELHRHALVQKMLGRCMPQCMRSPLPGDDAEAHQAVFDNFSQRAPVERPDWRARCEEERTTEARWPDFTDVAENGIAYPSG
jgi:hypothetical protein